MSTGLTAALAAVGGAVLVAGVGLGGYAYGTHHATPAAVATPSPTPVAPTPTASPSPTPSPTPATCFDTAQTQLALNDCAGAEAAKAAATLAKVLAEAHRRADDTDDAALDRAQRAWLAYRAAYCDSLAAGGTIDAMNVLVCRADLDTRRARDICTFVSPNAGPEDQPAGCAALDDER